MKLSSLISDINDIKIIKGDIDIEIKGIAYDSRNVEQGYVFVCISGFKTDGHNYVAEAVNKGAVAVIIERDMEINQNIAVIKISDTRIALALMSAAYFGYPAENIKLIGVTGTNGKTTTTYLIKSILENAGFNIALIGTISNIICQRETPSKRTTPESYDLQEMFSEMRNTDYCIMEVSSHSLELNRVAGCVFNSGIFTNLTRDHLDFHGTFENYLNAKLKLFKQSKMPIINIDDEYSNEIRSKIGIDAMTYSVNKDADVKAEDVEITSKYSKFKLVYDHKSVLINLPMPGRFNVYNALAAACACINEGVSLNLIRNGLEAIKVISGRSEVIDSKRGYTIIIDYAHTPDGLENILNTVHEYVKGRVISLFGCGGDRDKTKRPIMGEIAGKLSDFCIITSDNPRTEDPISIINDIIPGIDKTNCSYKIIENRRAAIKEALLIAKENDVIVIAGKGHETYQVLKEKTIHFDEREIVNEILEKEM